MTDSRKTWGVALVALCLAAGCASPTVGGASSELWLDDGTLEPLTAEDWSEAEAGCEGLIDEDVHFAIVSAEYGLVAAVESDGDVLCVDTIAAIEDELEDTGRAEEARALVSAYDATVRHRAGMSSTRKSGDPEPEPNRTWTLFTRFGDPEPEPNQGY